ncbi:hypothetical protein Hanom_Chr10g00915701 [Helianthus anomalus]
MFWQLQWISAVPSRYRIPLIYVGQRPSRSLVLVVNNWMPTLLEFHKKGQYCNLSWFVVGLCHRLCFFKIVYNMTDRLVYLEEKFMLVYVR